jgi:hypothetical protein
MINNPTEQQINNAEGTGSLSLLNNNENIIIYRFGEYNVSVKVGEKKEFLGIENISVSNIFYDYHSVPPEQDVIKYYQE